MKDRQSGRPPKWVSGAVLLASLLSGATPSLAQRIPSEVKSAVAFVLAPKRGSLGPHGTGFFVEVRKPTTDLSAVYFVTNKHVLLREEGGADLRPTLDLRLNAKDGKTTETFSINLATQGKDKNVFSHGDDPSVDLAVVPVEPDRGKYEFKPLSADLITTKDQYRSLQIAEGSEVFFAGLFWQFTGGRQNYPIVRFGRVALVTDERVPVDKKGTTADLYLVESSSYGGNSGSPVFFFLSSEGTPGVLRLNRPRVLRLAGVIQGSFLEYHPIVEVEAASVAAKGNSGIAAVVPAYKLHEILFGPELRTLRKW